MPATQVVLGSGSCGSFPKLERGQQAQDLMDANLVLCVCVCVVPIVALGQCCWMVRSQPLDSGYLGLKPHSTITKPTNSPSFGFFRCKAEMATMVPEPQEAVDSGQEDST